jgi:hypothetical protein
MITKTTIRRLIAGTAAAMSLVAVMLTGAGTAQAAVTFPYGNVGEVTVECYTDLHQANFTLNITGPNKVGATVLAQRWNGVSWVTLPGTTPMTGQWTLYRNWWGGVSPAGYYRHIVYYQWSDADGTVWTGHETLTSYRQMVKTRYGYLATSASYCTV